MDEEAAPSQAVEEPLLSVASSKTDSDVFEIEPYQELFISAKKKQLSINVLRFAIFVDAVAGKKKCDLCVTDQAIYNHTPDDHCRDHRTAELSHNGAAQCS